MEDTPTERLGCVEVAVRARETRDDVANRDVPEQHSESISAEFDSGVHLTIGSANTSDSSAENADIDHGKHESRENTKLDAEARTAECSCSVAGTVPESALSEDSAAMACKDAATATSVTAGGESCCGLRQQIERERECGAEEDAEDENYVDAAEVDLDSFCYELLLTSSRCSLSATPATADGLGPSIVYSNPATLESDTAEAIQPHVHVNQPETSRNVSTLGGASRVGGEEDGDETAQIDALLVRIFQQLESSGVDVFEVPGARRLDAVHELEELDALRDVQRESDGRQHAGLERWLREKGLRTAECAICCDSCICVRQACCGLPVCVFCLRRYFHSRIDEGALQVSGLQSFFLNFHSTYSRIFQNEIKVASV